MSQSLPDFLEVYKKFHDEQKFSNGDRAEIRRAMSPDDLEALPAFYKLLGSRLHQGSEKQWRRLVFFLIKELKGEGSDSLGRALARFLKNNPSVEKRMFQIVRSNSPNDLIQLRRLIKHLQPSFDFQKFAKLTWYWGDRSKKQLLKDFLMADNKKNGEKK